MGRDTPPAPPSLDAVRARIDQVDAELLRLIDERSSLAAAVAEAKKAAGGEFKFGLRPSREAQVIRKKIQRENPVAGPGLVVRVWRELIADSLARQGPFSVTVWGGRAEAQTLEAARQRFGVAPPVTMVTKPEDALAGARKLGGVGVLALTSDSSWWGRLLAEPEIQVFATLPCLAQWGPMRALAVGAVPVEPTGADQTLWVTDSPSSSAAIVETLGRDSVAAAPLLESGGLKLFSLAGFYQKHDERLARAPGRLSGVIGAAPEPFDV